MNKEQIEQIALEVANETIVHIASDDRASKYQITQFATRFLARVDEERAKEESVGTVGMLFDDHVIAKSGLGENQKVFLHPQPIQEGWKEAAIAWEVCASIHREYGVGKDALFKTRQQDFVRHAKTAREAMLANNEETRK